jgi:hypothetical protein
MIRIQIEQILGQIGALNIDYINPDILLSQHQAGAMTIKTGWTGK